MASPPSEIVILAAGKGSRLGSLPYPKVLLPLHGAMTLLDWQLSLFRQLLPKARITLVTGYQAELLIRSYPHIHQLESSHYAVQNTAKSLLLAMRSLDGPLLWINGDVVPSKEALKTLLEAPYGSALLVNSSPVGSEEVKYKTHPDGSLSLLSKEVAEAEGESLGLNKVEAHLLPLLIECLEACSDTDFFERAIELAIGRGARFFPVCVAADACIEVDFPEDLERARQLLNQWLTS